MECSISDLECKQTFRLGGCNLLVVKFKASLSITPFHSLFSKVAAARGTQRHSYHLKNIIYTRERTDQARDQLARLFERTLSHTSHSKVILWPSVFALKVLAKSLPVSSLCTNPAYGGGDGWVEGLRCSIRLQCRTPAVCA